MLYNRTKVSFQKKFYNLKVAVYTLGYIPRNSESAHVHLNHLKMG